MDELGTDALRFTLLVGSTPGNDTNLSLKKVEANRNFANKIWNAGRFVISALAALGGQKEVTMEAGESPMTLADAWILARLAGLERDVERLFQSHQYGEAGRQIYDFFWSEFADWYVEIAKLQLAEGGSRAFQTARHLVNVLDSSLRLLHPFTPFITEELWRHLKVAAQELSPTLASASGWEEALICARWPEPAPVSGPETGAIADFSLVMEIVRAIRNLRAEKNVPPGRRIPAILVGGDRAGFLQEQAATIAALAQLEAQTLEIVASRPEKTEDQVALVVGPVEIYLPLGGLVDITAERARLEKELQEAESQVRRLEGLLAGPFAEKAPPQVVQKERDKLAGYRDTLERLKIQLESL
jgi:valyl-tRNA synthetase